MYPRKKKVLATVAEVVDDPLALIAWLKTTEGRFIPVRHDANKITRDEFLTLYPAGSLHELADKGRKSL